MPTSSPSLAALFLVLATSPCLAADFHVAPDGADANPGTAEKPFATLERARQAARTDPGSTVILHDGSYVLDRTLVLTPEDSGTTFRAAKDADPKLMGGRAVTGWRKLTDTPVGLAEAAKGQLWVADIPKGWCFHYLYVDGQPAQRARQRNTHWRKWAKDFSFGEPDKAGQLVTFKNKAQLKDLPSNGDVEMVCIMAQYGIMGNGVLTDIRPEDGTVRWNSRQLNLRSSRWGGERGYNLENALPFLDESGEWCVDSAAGKVYFWPAAGQDMAKAQVIAPKLYELIRLQGDETKQQWVKNVTLQGLTLVCTDRLPEDQWPRAWVKRQWEQVDAMVYAQGAKDCTIADNRLLFSGSSGITLDHFCQGIAVVGNEIGWTGSDGVFLCGYGPGTLDVNKGNVVERNWIHDMGRGNYWHSAAVQVYQSGHNRISHNLMQNSAYCCLSITGCRPDTYLSNPMYFFPDDPKGSQGQAEAWNMFNIRTEDFSKEVQDGIRNKTFRFNRETIKPYLHSRENLVERNIIVEPETLLDEGGAIYAWGCGKGNVWKDNLIFKSSGMPGSSIMALDDFAEYFTITGNVIWVEGPAACGTIGARPRERGNVIHDNVRAMYKPAFKGRGNRGLPLGWWTNEEGRASVDKLQRTIVDEVAKEGGWPGNPKVGIPGPGEPLKKAVQRQLPKGSHVTIE